MRVWDSLKVVLVRLLEDQPGALTLYPSPHIDSGREPPFRIGLAAWASAAAEELHQRFGADVELVVGMLSYPSGIDQRSPWRADDAPVVDPHQISVDLGGPLAVRTGHTGREDLLLTNRTESVVVINTNGSLAAAVVEPGSNRVVGGSFGVATLALVMFRILPGATQKIPLIVGTASYDHTLGYAVPPGDWAVRATFPVNGTKVSTPDLPLTVIE